MSDHPQYDVLINGSGPTGCAVALALKGSGLKVLVLDKATFPRDKVCGDAIPNSASQALQKLSPAYLEEFLSFSEKVTIEGARLVAPNFKDLEVRFTRNGHVCTRLHFDHWLRSLAQRESGASFIEGQEVTKVALAPEGISATTKGGATFSARLAVAADGGHSPFARQLMQFEPDPLHHSGAVRAYYENVKGLQGNLLEVYFVKGYLPGYFWIFPLPNNRANVGFGMLSETISQRKLDLKKCLDDIVAGPLADRFGEARRDGPVRGFGLHLGSRRVPLSRERLLLAGDAGSLIDPFSGDGIGNGMQSGLIAAQTVRRAFEANDFSAAFLRQHDEAVFAKLGEGLRNSYRLQKVLGDRAWLINGIIGVAGRSRWVRDLLHKSL
jgi:geranylgeranyl reductase family protein